MAFHLNKKRGVLPINISFEITTDTNNTSRNQNSKARAGNINDRISCQTKLSTFTTIYFLNIHIFVIKFAVLEARSVGEYVINIPFFLINGIIQRVFITSFQRLKFFLQKCTMISLLNMNQWTFFSSSKIYKQARVQIEGFPYSL